MADLTGWTLLDRYRVEAFLGRGGMSEVYKVHDQVRSTHLALKLLREDLAQDRIFLRRFKREAQTLAKLQHPNIVRFYGLEHEGSSTFMLMDFIEGETLREEIFNLDGIPMAPARVLKIVQPLCSALSYAHSEGVIHCDLKPGNVMIHKNGTVQVTDFGIARMMDAATATMVGLGTPAYMAPELIRGHDPSPRSDIYSLGVILFEMVTGGERPFTGELATITGSTSEKVRWEQVHLNPPSPRKWNPEIPAELESIIIRCLNKDPAKRFKSINDVVGLLVGLPVEALPKEPGSQREVIQDSPKPLENLIHNGVGENDHPVQTGRTFRSPRRLLIILGSIILVITLGLLGNLNLSTPEEEIRITATEESTKSPDPLGAVTNIDNTATPITPSSLSPKFSPTPLPKLQLEEQRSQIAALRTLVEMDQFETLALADAKIVVSALERQLISLDNAYQNDQYDNVEEYVESIKEWLSPVTLHWRPDDRGDFNLICRNCETREVDGTIVEDISDDWMMAPRKGPEIPADFNLNIRYKPTGIRGGGLGFEFRSTGWRGGAVWYELGYGACPSPDPPMYACLNKMVPDPYPLRIFTGCKFKRPSYGNWSDLTLSAIGNVIEIWQDGFLACRYKDPDPILFGELSITGYNMQLESVDLEWFYPG